jgi:periplasmic protein CpxP/Spy
MNNPRNKWLVLLVIFLLLVNIGLILFFTMFKDDKRRRGGPGDRSKYMVEMMTRELSLNPQQVTAVTALVEENSKKIQTLFGSLQNSKDSLYKNFGQSAMPDSLLAKHTATIGDHIQQLDSMQYRYFQKIRALCNENQQKKFDELLPRFTRRGPGRGLK